VKERDLDRSSARRPRLKLLAAVARAQRHRTAPGVGVTRREIHAHLGAGPGSAAARDASVALEELTEDGALYAERRHGVAVWRLTARGRGLLASGGGAALASELPESPQHRAWRRARELAASVIERLRTELRRDLHDAAQMLASAESTPADAWFELAERLARDAWRVGSATYCLREWAEPADARADADTGRDLGDETLPRREREARRRRRAGRRNVALWEG
jgi:hypothetical protein